MKINHTGGLWVATVNGKSYASDTLVNAMRVAYLASLPRRSKDEQIKAGPISATVEEVMGYVIKKHRKTLVELAKV